MQKQYQIRVRNSKGKPDTAEIKEVSAYFFLEHWPGEGGCRLVHKPTGMLITNSRFQTEKDAEEFADGFHKLYGNDLGFTDPQSWTDIQNTQQRRWMCRLLAALSYDPYAQAAVSMGDIRSLSGRLKNNGEPR